MPLTLFSFILVNAFSVCAQGTWTQKADFGGSERANAASFAMNGRGYIGTGMAISLTSVKDMWEYRQYNNTWVVVGSVGTQSRCSATGFAILNEGYVTGGTGGGGFFQDLWEISPPYTIVQKASVPDTTRSMSVSFVIQYKAYMGLGIHGGNSFWCWEQATNSWTQVANFGGAPRTNAVAFAIGYKGYVATGDASGVNKKDMWEYDQATNTWTQKTDFPGSARYGATAFAMAGSGFVGTGWDGNWKKDIWRYDQVSDSWTQMPDMPPAIGRMYASGFAIGTKGYIGVGYSNYNYVKDFWEFAPVLPLSSVPYISKTPCFGVCYGFADLKAAGGTAPYTYTWSNGNTLDYCTGLCAGTYSAVVKDAANATVAVTFEIKQPTPVSDTVSVTDASSCSAADGSVSVTPSGGTPPYTFFWSNGASTSAFNALSPGTYSLTLKDSHTCSVTGTYVVSCPSAVAEQNEGVRIFYSPNPSAGIFSIRVPEGTARLEIYSVFGEKIYSSQIVSGRSEIDLSSQPDGVYFLQVRTEKGVVRKKIVISK